MDPPPMEFPHLKGYTRLTAPNDDSTYSAQKVPGFPSRDPSLTSPDNVPAAIYDIKFCQFTAPNVDPVFSAVAGRDIFVCKPGADGTLEVLRIITDPQEDASLNSVAWSQDLITGKPLLCVAGSKSKKIKILDVDSGQKVRVLEGHGGDINDLVTSPTSSQILASCSADYTIRLWNLDPQYARQPCAAILSGEGHRQPILSLSFHKTGKYLLSGGQDTMICLWAIPEIPDKNAGTDKPTMVYCPHFASNEILADYVDCVEFYGDLILSKSSIGLREDRHNRGDILLWMIEGFTSSNPLPNTPPISAPGQHTRSAFGGRFQRLLTFKMVDVSPFYMRFGLLDQPGHHPILVMGNIKAHYSFWDLQRLQESHNPTEENPLLKGNKKRNFGSAFAGLGTSLGRETARNSLASNDSSVRTSHVSTPASTASDRAKKFDVSDPYAPIPPHKAITVKCPINFTCRAVAWSNDGKWCVAAGDSGMLAMFKRWDSKTR